MQTVETLNEGLKRGYTLTIPANDVAKRIEAEIKSIAPQIRMPGFRPGKVPTNLVKKMHGPAIEQDVLNKAVSDGIQQLLSEQQLRPATQPSVELDEGYETGKDVELKVELEVLPDVPTPAIENLKLERLAVADIGEGLVVAPEGRGPRGRHQELLEQKPLGLEAGGIHVRQIVGDDIELSPERVLA